MFAGRLQNLSATSSNSVIELGTGTKASARKSCT